VTCYNFHICAIFREEEAIKLDGLSVAQMKELHDKAEKHAFQAEVDRMMKLIINSLYKNKEVGNLQLILHKMQSDSVTLKCDSYNVNILL